MSTNKFISADNIRQKKSNILNANSPFVITEAYKMARTNLRFSLATGEDKVVVFTSANPTEGKTSTCVNLSITFAEMGASVLLIDADLRKPIIHKLLEVSNKNGLSSLLGGFCNVNAVIKEDIRENLDVITAGPIPPNPAELLASENMIKLISVLKNHYDYIFIDTPPINVVTDSQLMNSVVSGIVFIVMEEKTTHPDIQRALRAIELAQGKLLGFIKSNCNARSSSSYKKYKGKYQYQYSYGKKPSQKTQKVRRGESSE